MERLGEILSKHQMDVLFVPIGEDSGRWRWATFAFDGEEHRIEVYPDNVVMHQGDSYFECYMPEEWKSEEALIAGFAVRLDRYLSGGDWAGPDEKGLPDCIKEAIGKVLRKILGPLALTLTLTTALLSSGGCLPIFGSCSGPRLDHEEFCALTPEEQVQTWRGLYDGKACIGHGQHFRFLDCIVKQGCAGADAVIPLLRETKTPFLVDDAVYVVRFVHLRTCSLKNHEALEALREVEKSKLDPGIRQRAVGGHQRN